jgi:hypothetical protein
LLKFATFGTTLTGLAEVLRTLSALGPLIVTTGPLVRRVPWSPAGAFLVATALSALRAGGPIGAGATSTGVVAKALLGRSTGRAVAWFLSRAGRGL